MSFAAVQKHVAVLERAGLVTKRRRGREQLVEAAPEAIATRMAVRSTFFSREGMEGMAEGFAEGLRLGVSRMEVLQAK
jgi:DNA-binding transcriptional ArsR family regulator